MNEQTKLLIGVLDLTKKYQDLFHEAKENRDTSVSDESRDYWTKEAQIRLNQMDVMTEVCKLVNK
jgi:hypothetical protein|tara:strand:- start:425 stop:619 length:195 start_codon:yes stop_codon:yes gene_type:complete